MVRIRFAILLALALWAAQGVIAAAQQNAGDASGDSLASPSVNWPMFKNQASRLGFNSLESTINKSNATSLRLAWVGVMGKLADFSSPAIVDGVAYIGSTDGNLYAFNASGCGQSQCDPLWKGTMDPNFFVLSSPAVVNGMVYIGSENHKLYVFSAAGCGQSTCSPLWTGQTAGAIFAGPLVANNRVYVASEDKRLYAFNANGCGRSTCAPLWTDVTGGALDSAPAIDGSLVYVGSQDGKLYAFPANGCTGLFCRPLWTGQAGVNIFGSSPAVVNGVVYIASFNEADGRSSRLYAFRASGCGRPSCDPLWSAPAGEFVQSSPAVANGKVYVGSGDDLIYAFDANGCNQPTCSAVWRGEAVGSQAGMVSAPAVANGLVYIGENNGSVVVFDANGCDGNFCLPVTQLPTQNEPIVSSSPAVVNGNVYFGSDDQEDFPPGRLYVFNLGQ